MIRLIDANALLKSLKSGCENCSDANTNWCEHCCKINDFEDLIDNAPTVHGIVAFVERPQGEWISNYQIVGESFINPGRRCSLCGKVVEFSENYCPNCGADMRGEVK